MEKLRKVNIKLQISIFFMTTVAVTIAIYLILSSLQARDYSATPEQAMQKLQTAILQGDESKIASLFVDDATFQRFMAVPINSVNSKVFPTSLRRTASESSLHAWKSWFTQYGISHIGCRPTGSSEGISCIPFSNGGFAFKYKFVKKGYLIDDCSFSI